MIELTQLIRFVFHSGTGTFESQNHGNNTLVIAAVIVSITQLTIIAPLCVSLRLRLLHTRSYVATNCTLMLLINSARSEAWVCGRSLVGTAGSNPTGGMDVCLLWVLCVVRWRSLRRDDHSSRGVLPIVVCLIVIVNPR
jgi:hypothetical protein